MKSKLVQGTYGKVRIIEGLYGRDRSYVKKTNLNTYVVSKSSTLTLDSMVEIDGEFHFSTLKQLHEALDNVCN